MDDCLRVNMGHIGRRGGGRPIHLLLAARARDLVTTSSFLSYTMHMEQSLSLSDLASLVHACDRCERLRAWCETAQGQQARYRDQPYWGKPVAGFGDQNARIVIIGLAPGRHGANRTGRPFTGDAAGVWLYDALFRYGFANSPSSTAVSDGLTLHDVYITNLVRCAPPGDKPLRDEIDACQTYLHQELTLLPRSEGVLALGRVAFEGYIRWLQEMGEGPKKRPVFEHGRVYRFDRNKRWLLASYHCSQRNTRSGRLTPPMWNQIFEQLGRLVSANNDGETASEITNKN